MTQRVVSDMAKPKPGDEDFIVDSQTNEAESIEHMKMLVDFHLDQQHFQGSNTLTKVAGFFENTQCNAMQLSSITGKDLSHTFFNFAITIGCGILANHISNKTCDHGQRLFDCAICRPGSNQTKYFRDGNVVDDEDKPKS